MLVTSHAAFAWSLSRRPLVTLGAAGPDLSALAFALKDLVTGTPRDKVLHRAYRLPNRRKAHRAGHSFVTPAVLAVAGARQLAIGWTSHILVDVATHHSDAWAPLRPFSTRRWRSPVSYWEVEYHARAFQTVESLALAALAARARGVERGALGVALVFAALPLFHDNAHGLPGFAGLRDRRRPPTVAAANA
jgi:hypothetical protein